MQNCITVAALDVFALAYGRRVKSIQRVSGRCSKKAEGLDCEVSCEPIMKWARTSHMRRHKAEHVDDRRRK
jgi:hypothetical protein